MKRLADSTYSKRKKAKNTFSLGTFGYNNLHASSSTSTSAGARPGNLTADGRHAAVRSLPIQWERDNPPIPDAADDTDWLDLPDESFSTDPDTGHQRKRKWKWYATTVHFFFPYFLMFTEDELG